MAFSFTTLSIIFFFGGIASLLIGAVLWNRRPAPGVIPLFCMMIASAILIMSSAFEAGAAELSVRIICIKISYLGIVSLGVFWLAFAQDYSGSKWWKRPRNLALICILPVITILLAWTNELHHWQWSNIYLIEGPLGLTSVWEHGPWYMVNPFYQYFLNLIGIIILLRYGLGRNRANLKPVLIILGGALIPIIGSLCYIMRFDPAEGFDLTPLYMTVGTIVFSIAVFRYRFLDILPVAHKALITSIPDGILVLNSQEEIVEINPAAERILNKNKSEVLGKSLVQVWPELFRIIADPKDTVHAEITAGELSAPIYLDVNSVTLRDDKKRQVGELVVLTDISQVKTAQKKLESLYDSEHTLRNELEEEIKTRGQYSRSIVHELRTPLTSLSASGELLEELITDPVQTKLIKNIRRSTANLEQRVNDMFELARGELGLLKIEPAPMDINQLIQDVVSEMGPLATGKGLRLYAETPEMILPVMGDKGRLKQVLINLIGNSLKFTEKGEIVVRTRSHGSEFLKIEVSDTGKGMDREQMEFLFDPYHRKQKKGVTSGLGMGLAISKIFVELHQGKIWAESTTGKGTTISFTVPLSLTEESTQTESRKQDIQR